MGRLVFPLGELFQGSAAMPTISVWLPLDYCSRINGLVFQGLQSITGVYRAVHGIPGSQQWINLECLTQEGVEILSMMEPNTG